MSNPRRLVKGTVATSEMLNDYAYKCESRQEPGYFSREGGKIGFVNMIMITLNFQSKTIQMELNDFFKKICDMKETARKQAYSEGRFKLMVAAFRLLFERVAKLAAVEFDKTEIKTFKGYRLCAIDGITVNLEDTCATRGYYGTLGSGEGCAAARISVAADVLNASIILDAQIGKIKYGERELALQHLARLLEMGMQSLLLIFDRSYASVELFAKMKDVAFLFRLKRRFNNDIDRLPLGDHVGDFNIKGQIFRLRVAKFVLSTGEIETLVTNLTSESASLKELKELYHLRWGVETAYRGIKSLLELENFTGTSQLIIEQEFFATMYLKNMVAFSTIKINATMISLPSDDMFCKGIL